MWAALGGIVGMGGIRAVSDLAVGSISAQPGCFQPLGPGGPWRSRGIARDRAGMMVSGIWWTWSGSNRRPLPCHF